DAGPSALGHDFAEPSRRLAVLPDVRLEMNRRLGAAHLLLDGVEKGAVLDQLDRIALDQRALREADERRQERLELGVGMNDEMRLAVTAQRPDDEQQKRDDGDERGYQHDQTFSPAEKAALPARSNFRAT